jgi:hypothetical protein
MNDCLAPSKEGRSPDFEGAKQLPEF